VLSALRLPPAFPLCSLRRKATNKAAVENFFQRRVAIVESEPQSVVHAPVGCRLPGPSAPSRIMTAAAPTFGPVAPVSRCKHRGRIDPGLPLFRAERVHNGPRCVRWPIYHATIIASRSSCRHRFNTPQEHPLGCWEMSEEKKRAREEQSTSTAFFFLAGFFIAINSQVVLRRFLQAVMLNALRASRLSGSHCA
jgi:hypothetical protein